MSVVKKLEGIDARQFQKRVIKAGRINSTEDAIEILERAELEY